MEPKINTNEYICKTNRPIEHKFVVTKGEREGGGTNLGMRLTDTNYYV